MEYSMSFGYTYAVIITNKTNTKNNDKSAKYDLQFNLKRVKLLFNIVPIAVMERTEEVAPKTIIGTVKE
jgi:hypothetical protein